MRKHQASQLVCLILPVPMHILRASRALALLGVPALSFEMPPALTSAASNSDSRVFWPGLNCMPWSQGRASGKQVLLSYP